MGLILRRSAPMSWVRTNLGNQACGGTRCFRQDAGQPWSLLVGSNRDRCFRFETRLGDFAPGETDRTRSELQFDRKYDHNRDIWFAWDFRVTIIGLLSTASIIVGQLHQTADVGDADGYPVFELEIGPDGKLYIYSATVAEAFRPTFYPRTLRAGPLDFQFGALHRLVCRVRTNWLGQAILYVWLNGVLIVGQEYISVGMNDLVGTYLKIGTYSRPETANQTNIVEYYGVTEGYDDLSHRIAA